MCHRLSALWQLSTSCSIQMTGTASDPQSCVSQEAESKIEFFVQVAEFYIQRDGLLVLEEDQQVRLAISKLDLSSLKPFIPKWVANINLVKLTPFFSKNGSGMCKLEAIRHFLCASKGSVLKRFTSVVGCRFGHTVTNPRSFKPLDA